MSKSANGPTRQKAPRKPRPSIQPPLETQDGGDPRAALGEIIYTERMRLGISQEELAARAGLDRTYVSGMERGLRNPTFLVLLRLARELAIDPAILVRIEIRKAPTNL
ncbi:MULTISPECIES: helix-turn-helix domain-containing protein [Nguyenibacter]|uniref:Helix-turn-helix transcriptional regulator n=1 Tax=Nguyenibacter vanlangensis TaxID=1216886 RepID=A0A7Y7IUR4_9PROT|nr:MULTISPECIES: helix-turn-helix transcriptional regulator [Nguyenibacter]NVN10170.1 helix-turn-helix transcriptional regulator [Nguyenibacter vanlangensis]WRH86514.1 helix-turn-helix transcriptional regulator [Nguyenibacter sp. L1]